MRIEHDDDSPTMGRKFSSRLGSWQGKAGDWMRLYAGAIGLNTRKTYWILRGRGEHAPCQSESDSGRGGETQCDASIHWVERRNFRRICPHLQRQADGQWRCGVNATRVQPFWGRALGWWGATLAALWIVGTIPIWTVLWKTGVRTNYWHVVWPGSWGEISHARADFYVRQAEQAMAAKRFEEMIICLQSALRSDPRNFSAALYMANISWVQGNYPTANERFGAMLRDFPEQRITVARAWLPKLLVLGDTKGIKDLALSMLANDAGAPGPWAHALIFAARQTDDPAVLVQAIQMPKLPPAFRPVLAANAAGISGQLNEARKLLVELVPAGDQAAFVSYQQLEGLLEFGVPDLALDRLDRTRPVLDGSQLLFFRLRAYSQLGWGETSLKTVRDSFRGIDLTHLNAIATYLIRCHDRPALLRTLEMMDQSPKAEKLDVTFAMLYLAAGLWGDRDLLPKVARLSAEKSPLSTSMLARFDQIALRPGYLGEAMGVLPLPLEAVYAAHSVLHAASRSTVTAEPGAGASTSRRQAVRP